MMADQREGADITAADMVIPEEIPSEILSFYDGLTVFMTGATGFLGKLFIEKLLRTCNIKHIYILVRIKKNIKPEERLNQLFDQECFEPLKRLNPNFMEKITIIHGDCVEPNLGISLKDQEKLIREVSCIIHCAATVRFDQALKIATWINVRATKDLLAMARQMKQLKAFLYVSTAFCNCIRKNIDETFYQPPIKADNLFNLVQSVNDKKLEELTESLIKPYPNTYVYTKNVAEDLIKDEAGNLPIGILRPSIVISSVKEPIAGWLDNFYGATGVLVGAALGVLRCLLGDRENLAEMVPVDYVVNAGLVVAWETAQIKSLNANNELAEEKKPQIVRIYNFVSSVESPVNWREVTDYGEKHFVKYPTNKMVWHYYFVIRKNELHHKIAQFFFETIPAYLVDFIAKLIGKEPQMVEGYIKINRFKEVISYFTQREWIFKNDNLQTLWKRLNSHDKRLFEFSMEKFDWESYFETYGKGMRVYLLKDPLDTLPEGKVTYYKLMISHYCLVTVLFIIFLYFLRLIFGYIFNF